jgi:K+/H+ antiporter YhaU regulatory subunit KhtT
VKSINDIELRNNTRVTLLAIKRGDDIMEHPSFKTVFKGGDLVYVLGDPEQINLAFELFNKEI